jgi:hypothetical protein
MNNPNTLNPGVLTETLSVRLLLDFIKALIAAARAKNVTLSHFVRGILEKSAAVKSRAGVRCVGDIDDEVPVDRKNSSQ